MPTCETNSHLKIKTLLLTFPLLPNCLKRPRKGIFRKGQRMQCLRALPCDDLSSAHNWRMFVLEGDFLSSWLATGKTRLGRQKQREGNLCRGSHRYRGLTRLMDHSHPFDQRLGSPINAQYLLASDKKKKIPKKHDCEFSKWKKMDEIQTSFTPSSGKVLKKNPINSREEKAPFVPNSSSS